MDKTAIDITLLNGEKLVASFPTDEQWIARAKRRKLIQRTVKGETTSEVENAEVADLALFREITTRPDFADADEASLAIEELAAVSVTAIEREGEGFRVEILTFFGTEGFVLKRPTAAQVKRFRSFVTPVDLAHGRTELRMNLGVAATIFDELCPGVVTSMLYKVAVASAVISEVQRPLEPSERP